MDDWTAHGRVTTLVILWAPIRRSTYHLPHVAPSWVFHSRISNWRAGRKQAIIILLLTKDHHEWHHRHRVDWCHRWRHVMDSARRLMKKDTVGRKVGAWLPVKADIAASASHSDMPGEIHRERFFFFLIVLAGQLFFPGKLFVLVRVLLINYYSWASKMLYDLLRAIIMPSKRTLIW